jgi:hypothetical protein
MTEEKGNAAEAQRNSAIRTSFARVQTLVGKHAFAVLNSQAICRGRCIGWRGGSIAIVDARGVVRLTHPRYVFADYPL